MPNSSCSDLGWSQEAIAASRLTLDDHTTAFVEIGDGAPLVILHSLGLDWRMGAPLMSELGGNFRSIAYDLRSHGSTTATPETFTLEACVEDLVRLLDRIEIERARIAGFSLGGSIAQLFALEHPHRLEGLALVCTTSKAEPRTFLARAEAAERRGMASVTPDTLHRWFNEEAVAANPNNSRR